MASDIEGARVLPWADWSEWNQLKQMLTDGDVKGATERLSIYQLRRPNAVPIAVVTSVALANQLSSPSQNPHSRRMSLAMTIVRFVNGITDRLQPRGEKASAKSVYSLAISVHLPLILVEIRHQSSHNNLPRLASLESAARQALLWLEQYYWEPQLNNIHHLISHDLSHLKTVFGPPPVEDTISSMEDDNAFSQLSSHEIDGEDGLILRKLRQLVKEKSAVQSNNRIAKRKSVGNVRWAVCNQRDAWKGMPLGLAPGQKRVPRFVKPSILPPLDRATTGAMDKSNESQSEHSLIEEENCSGDRPVPECLHQKNILSEQDEAYVTEIASGYKKLILNARPVSNSKVQ